MQPTRIEQTTGSTGESIRGIGRRDLILRTAGVFSLVGIAGGTLRSARADTSTVVLTPQEEQGPYFVDGQAERSDVLYDTTTDTVQAGLHLLLFLTVNQVASGVVSALPNARVDIWQANAAGLYSDEAVEGTTGANYLRGYQITDASGKVQFLTIYPGWYSGRTPHIHCMVRLMSGTTTTYEFETQFFFPDELTTKVYELAPYASRAASQDTNNTNDRVFNYVDCDTGVTSGDEMFPHILRSNSAYMQATYTMNLDLTAPAPTCIGVSDGGINEGGMGGGPGGGNPPQNS